MNQIGVDRARATVKIKQRLIDCNEIADLRHEFDDAAGGFCEIDKGVDIDAQDDTRCSSMRNDSVRRAQFLASAFGNVRADTRLRVDSLNNRNPAISYIGQNRNWTEQSRRGIDQI